MYEVYLVTEDGNPHKMGEFHNFDIARLRQQAVQDEFPGPPTFIVNLIRADVGCETGLTEEEREQL